MPSFDRPLSRREVLRMAGAGVLGSSMSGWRGSLAANASLMKTTPAKSCILLWADGAASQKETFDPKPQSAHPGPFRPIATCVPGIQISEALPRLAKLMDRAAVVRSMSTKIPRHGAARMLMHTGYYPFLGGLNHPPLGAVVSAKLGRVDSPMPNFVVCGTTHRPLDEDDFGIQFPYIVGSGYLGPEHGAFIISDIEHGIDHFTPPTGRDDFRRRLDALEQLEVGFQKEHQAEWTNARRTQYHKAVELMRSNDAKKAFDLARETPSTRERYGNHDFGRGCLLARRLVEAGVRFVEVYHADWDTHEAKQMAELPRLCGELDQGASVLITELAERGMLQDTLIVWMTEFGRSAKIDERGGRGHQPKAWSSVLWGGGVKGGQVVGSTDKEGAEVTERPVSAAVFIATICSLLGIDPRGQLKTTWGCAMPIVEDGAQPITEII